MRLVDRGICRRAKARSLQAVKIKRQGLAVVDTREWPRRPLVGQICQLADDNISIRCPDADAPTREVG